VVSVVLVRRGSLPVNDSSSSRQPCEQSHGESPRRYLGASGNDNERRKRPNYRFRQLKICAIKKITAMSHLRS
jgi:hypothetical protein